MVSFYMIPSRVWSVRVFKWLAIILCYYARDSESVDDVDYDKI